MPNWCEGTIKMRGKRDNILYFFRKGINVYGFDGGNYVVQDREKWYNELDSFEIHIKEDAYIEGTRRAFIKAQDVYLIGEDIVTVCFDAMQAWEYKPEEFLKIAKDYKLSIKGYGIECGMQFCQEFEIVTSDKDGISETRITIDNHIKYDDWEWECPFPFMGG